MEFLYKQSVGYIRRNVFSIQNSFESITETQEWLKEQLTQLKIGFSPGALPH
jgi:hypothetical protein